jgi:DNA-binding CsgD family transcriptional regulator
MKNVDKHPTAGNDLVGSTLLPSSGADPPAVEVVIGGHPCVVVPDAEAENPRAVYHLDGLRHDASQIVGWLTLGGEAYVILCVEASLRSSPTQGTRRRPIDILTERELQIALLVREGRVNKQIAHCLHITPNTVQSHLKRMFCKLGVSTRAAMVRKLDECLYQVHRPQS